jgi:hypothetical protein
LRAGARAKRRREKIIELCAKHFTVRELKAMGAFYGTPDGRAIATGPPLPPENTSDTLKDRRVAAQRYFSVIGRCISRTSSARFSSADGKSCLRPRQAPRQSVSLTPPPGLTGRPARASVEAWTSRNGPPTGGPAPMRSCREASTSVSSRPNCWDESEALREDAREACRQAAEALSRLAGHPPW